MNRQANMNQQDIHRVNPRRAQQGATLIVALIMLMMLTLVGVAGMRDTLLQEKMVGNMRDREAALQAAEAALRAGEIAAQNSNSSSWTNPGFVDIQKYTPRIAGGQNSSEQKYWSPDNYTWTNSNSVAYSPTELNDLSKMPRFVVEQLPTDMSSYGSGASLFSGGGSGGMVGALDLVPKRSSVTRRDYRVTAVGWGLSADAVVVLQSTIWK